MHISLPLHQFWDIVMVWVTSGKGAELCNAWIDFQYHYEETFAEVFLTNPRCSARMKKWRWILGLLTTTSVVGLSSGIIGEIFLGTRTDTFGV